MSHIARILLIAAVIALTLGVMVGALATWPVGPIALAVIIVARFAKRGVKRWTTLGSARWADERDLQKLGLMGGTKGLNLGRLVTPKRRIGVSNIGSLFNRSLPSLAACQALLRFGRQARDQCVRLAKSCHVSVFIPTGGGKFVSYVGVMVKECSENMIVFDPKGEAAAFGEYRRKTFGHEVIYIDPFHVVTDKPSSFDPLSMIDATQANALDDVNDAAASLVVRSVEAKDPHFDDTAEGLIAALAATAVAYGDHLDGGRSLQGVRNLFHPERMEAAIQAMEASDCYAGMLKRLGANLRHLQDREKASVLSTATRHLRFLDSPAISESTKRSDFDPSIIRRTPCTIFLILPPDRIRANIGLIRLWISSLLRVCARGGIQRSKDRTFYLRRGGIVGEARCDR